VKIFDLDRWNEIISALKKNKLRTFFTAFGVFWGIFMLIIMLGSGKGLDNGVSQGMGDMATNSMFMWTQRTTLPYKGFPRGRFFNFNNDDTKALTNNISEIEYIAPKLRGWGGNGGNNVVRKERTAAFTIQGNYPDYNLIDPAEIIKGRYINDLDIEEKRKVAVIGQRVYNEMFEQGEEAIGEYLKIQGVFFQVVGIYNRKRTINKLNTKKEKYRRPKNQRFLWYWRRNYYCW